MTREEIREHTMQIVYQMDIASNFDYNQINIVSENKNALKKKQAVDTLTAIGEHIEDIDSMITQNTDKWSPERIAKTEMSILRIAVAEMLYVDSIPTNVSINEAVELSKKYGDDRSYAFVNAILSRIDKTIEA